MAGPSRKVTAALLCRIYGVVLALFEGALHAWLGVLDGIMGRRLRGSFCSALLVCFFFHAIPLFIAANKQSMISFD